MAELPVTRQAIANAIAELAALRHRDGHLEEFITKGLQDLGGLRYPNHATEFMVSGYIVSAEHGHIKIRLLPESLGAEPNLATNP